VVSSVHWTVPDKVVPSRFKAGVHSGPCFSVMPTFSTSSVTRFVYSGGCRAIGQHIGHLLDARLCVSTTSDGKH
jgi:hypothetical protein